MTRRRYIFVIENVLGHVVHGMNIERVLATRDDIDGSVVKISMGTNRGVRALPRIDNWSLQASWVARRRLHDMLATQRPDALFVHTQVAALMLNDVMRQIPTVISVDATPINFDTMAEAYRHEHHARMLERVKLAVNRRALRAASAVVTWSHWAAQSVVHDYGVPPDRVQAIYPGVDLQHFRPRPTPRKPGPVRILFVGGDFRRKGGTDLLSAAVGLDVPVEVDIVTASEGIVVPPSLHARVHNQVEANSARMAGLYQDADIFALPTLGDCTPLAVAEALASGLPIVASSVGSIPDMVVAGENGLLVPPGEPVCLAAALSRLAVDESLRVSFGARSRQIAEREHDSFANCERLFDLMHCVSDRRTGALPRGNA